MSILLFDSTARENFLPLTYTRALADVYAGAMTFKQWWEKIALQPVYILTENYLQNKYDTCPADEVYIYINAMAVPDEKLWKAVQTLDFNEIILNNKNIPVAFKSKENYQTKNKFNTEGKKEILLDVEVLQYPHELVENNKKYFALQKRFFSKNNHSKNLSDTNILINPDEIYIEEGCTVEGCIINASDGPVYISKNCLLMEGSLIRGPFFMGENSVLKMGAKVYGATTVGKKCTIGGEVKNIILHDYSNKAHDGYLGDSLIGSWCNFGAGTSCSNVKNTGGEVKIQHRTTNDYINAGLKFGIITGDYVRTAINTSINSGTSMGVCCSVHDEKNISVRTPNFSWGNKGENSYQLAKAIKHIENWMAFKGEEMREEEKQIVEWLYLHGQ